MAKKKEESEVYAKCLERKEIYKQFNKLKLDFDKYFLCLQKRKDKRHAERLWLIDVQFFYIFLSMLFLSLHKFC